MCGILGVLSPAGRVVPDDRTLCAARDLMRHRGPDGAGLWRHGTCVLAHRRLSVIDLTDAGAQPMTGRDGALVYNGELYNDAELRASLRREFRSRCDTETLLACLEEHGAEALPLLRGMYALGYADTRARTLLLARDPLGIKPLYYAHAATGELLFASEIAPLLSLPGVRAELDPVVVRSYLATVRTTLGPRTLYKDIRTLRPGEWLLFSLDAPSRVISRGFTPLPDPAHAGVRDVVRDSIRAHLRTDVPMCSLLSGGLDSSIIAAETAREVSGLRTYCSGAPTSMGEPDDFGAAREVARTLGTTHTEAPITRELFVARWRDIVRRTRVPMSTPNEVAINEVARTLRAQGNVVALSGEGADELFGGYDLTLSGAHELHRAGKATLARAAEAELAGASWIPADLLEQTLNPGVLEAEGGARTTLEAYESEFRAAGYDQEHEPLRAHLRVQRRVNLAGLLLRLDSATMLESVEGRTPFADVVVAAYAESLPIAEKFDPAARDGESPADRAARTKLCLRRAYAEELPAMVVRRAKASFPLPFQEWIMREDVLEPLLAGDFARGVLTPQIVAALRARPAGLWRVAWPALNLCAMTGAM